MLHCTTNYEVYRELMQLSTSHNSGGARIMEALHLAALQYYDV